MEVEVSESRAEIRAEATDGIWLGGAVKTDDLAVTAEGSRRLFGLPDVVKVAEDGFALTLLLLAGQGLVADMNGVVEVAQLVEEAALLGSAKMDDIHGGAETSPAIMDHQLQPIVAMHACRFQVAEKVEPVVAIFLGG